MCFLCRATGGQLTTSNETSEARFVDLAEIPTLNMHPSIRLRIYDFSENHDEAVIG